MPLYIRMPLYIENGPEPGCRRGIGAASAFAGTSLRLAAPKRKGWAARDFGIASNIGYEIFDRDMEHGLSALSDRSSRSVRYANQLPEQIESLIVQLKAEKPHWRARRIREVLVGQAFGSSASCTISDTSISDSSTWSRKTCNPLDNPFGTRLSPMS